MAKKVTSQNSLNDKSKIAMRKKIIAMNAKNTDSSAVARRLIAKKEKETAARKAEKKGLVKGATAAAGLGSILVSVVSKDKRESKKKKK